MITKMQHERARSLVKKYGQNPTSYLALENDKHLYFGTKVEGVIAYGIVGKVVIICGDPICAQDDFLNLLKEFKSWYEEYSFQCIFLGTTDVFIKQYMMLGYRHLSYGEEARFHLASYQLSGKQMRKMRERINHANEAGLTTHEYKFKESRDPAIEEEFHSISEHWLQSKNNVQLKFTIGSVGLENPMDRRYFYARNTEGRIIAFHVFTPFAGMNGYTAEITQRLPEAPRSVTEKINYEAFMKFKDEGVEWGSLGLAPLANIRKQGEKHNVFSLVYEIGNRFFGFKTLHQAKRKYNPTMWVPGYCMISTKNITPRMMYAIFRIQNPGNIKDYFRNILFKERTNRQYTTCLEG